MTGLEAAQEAARAQPGQLLQAAQAARRGYAPAVGLLVARGVYLLARRRGLTEPVAVAAAAELLDTLTLTLPDG